MNDLQKKALLLTVILAVITTITYIYSSQPTGRVSTSSTEKPGQYHNLTLFHKSRDIRPFELQDHKGQRFTNENLMGQWNLLFFGFTHCPDICPPTLFQLKSFINNLGNSPVLPRVFFVSVDPQRDSPAVIADYLKRFHPDFIGAVGNELELIRLAKQLGIYFEKSNAQADPHAAHGQHGPAKKYLINHSGSILVVDPAGKLAGLFSTPHDAGKMADAWRKLISG